MKKIKLIVKWGIKGLIFLAVFGMVVLISALGIYETNTPIEEALWIGLVTTLVILAVIAAITGLPFLYDWANDE